MSQGKTVSKQSLTSGLQAQASTWGWQDLLKFAPLWGVAGFVGFYALLPVMPVQQELLVRYCTSHPIEYVTMALFFLGMATLLVRRFELAQEEGALKQCADLVASVSYQSLVNARQNAEALRLKLQAMLKHPEHSVAGRRLGESLQYYEESQALDKLDDHLRHVADREYDRAAQRFGFINTISWAVPILGFLGTVMGITLAIANVTPDQLDQSLPEVTSGLAVAFDTTALSLTLSMVLVFTTYLVRRKQDVILSGVDQQIDHRVCFLLKKGGAGTLSQNHAEISGQLVEASAMIVSEAMSVWRSNLQKLEQSFASSLEQEQLRVADVLRQGVSATLKSHQEELREQRDQDLQRQAMIGEQIETAMQRWEQSLEVASSHLLGQTKELKHHSDLIISLIDKQRELTEIQRQIHDSLDAHQITATLDQTLNSLTAAIQLLSVRTHLPTRAA